MQTLFFKCFILPNVVETLGQTDRMQDLWQTGRKPLRVPFEQGSQRKTGLNILTQIVLLPNSWLWQPLADAGRSDICSHFGHCPLHKFDVLPLWFEQGTCPGAWCCFYAWHWCRMKKKKQLFSKLTDVPRPCHRSAVLHTCLPENKTHRLRPVIRRWWSQAFYQEWISSLESLPAPTLLSQPYSLPVSCRLPYFSLQFLCLFLVCIIVPALFPFPVRCACLPLSAFSPRPFWSIYPSPPLTAPCRLSPPCISAWTCACRRKGCCRLHLPFLSPGQAAVMGPNALLIPVTSQNIPADAHTGPITSTHKHPGPWLKLLRGTCEYLTLWSKVQ